jgi:1-acyl-sn-glycerol-3-phosphate acyltransferase
VSDDPEAGATSSSRPQAGETPLPAPHLRGQLPGLEPDREITDWGRSERLEAVADRTLFGFLYHYWFRVEVEGIENVPADGGALLVANRSGALPSDAVMIAKAIRDEHAGHRVVHLATKRVVKALPVVGMLATKLGTVQSHQADLQRLLFDECELVLQFPEGPDGARKPLIERYRLREFDEEFVPLARRTEVPIVPVAVIGAEESQPVLARIPGPFTFPFTLLGHRYGHRRRLPITTALPLPAKLKIRFLEPVAPQDDPALEAGLAQEIRALIQENLLEMVAGRRSVWLG